ncbi:N-6 DNA methylase [Amycolatopsis sp. NPDC003865]
MTVEPRVEAMARRLSNFGHLIRLDSQLFLLGASAEAYVYKDANTSMLKSRQFGERLTQLLWTELRLTGHAGTQHERVQTLYAQGVINDVVRALFTDVRRTGNQANHEELLDDRNQALQLVRACYDLGVWYHRTIPDAAEPPPFIPPALPDSEPSTGGDEFELYKEELVRMNYAINAQTAKLDEQTARARAEAAARAKAERDILDAVRANSMLRDELRELSDKVNRLYEAFSEKEAPYSGSRAEFTSRARTSNDRILADKLWSLSHVLRDEGISTVDYLDILAPLLLLKLSEERANANDESLVLVPESISWHTLASASQNDLIERLQRIMDQLGRLDSYVGEVFQNTIARITNPVILRRLVDLIDGENWSASDKAHPGYAFDALLERPMSEARSGAGQYFTPRALIDAIIDCAAPTPRDTIFDPACGTGGFLVGCYEYILRNHRDELTANDIEHLADGGISGMELVRNTARLAAVNLALHGLGRVEGSSLIEIGDSLAQRPKRRASLVLSNPPFGRKMHVVTIGAEGAVQRIQAPSRQSWVQTTDKQMNFVQHVMDLLRVGGRAAMIVPDNALFQGGAGESVRRKLLEKYNLHTVLRLPTGIFYAGGVKANVVFFDKPATSPDKPATNRVWVYDFRTDQQFRLSRPMRREDLDDFVRSYLPNEPISNRTESERFRAFDYEELTTREHLNLDITWRRSAAS